MLIRTVEKKRMQKEKNYYVLDRKITWLKNLPQKEKEKRIARKKMKNWNK